MKIAPQEILETFSDRFKKHWWNKEDINDIKGFTFSDKDDDFTEAVKSYLETINVKNRHLDIKGVEFKTLSVNLKTDRTILSVDAGEGFGEVERWMKIDVMVDEGEKRNNTAGIKNQKFRCYCSEVYAWSHKLLCGRTYEGNIVKSHDKGVHPIIS